MGCPVVQRHMDAYVDGEIDPTARFEFDRHFAECEVCRELFAFQKAFRAQVHATLSEVRAPEGLRARIESALQAEREAANTRGPWFKLIPIRGRYLVPALGVAAAAVLAQAAVVTLSRTEGGDALRPITADVVDLHTTQPPADLRVTRPEETVPYFRGKVEFPVRPMVFEEGRRVRIVGARLASVRAHRAAAFYYETGDGRPVTVVAFDRPSMGDESIEHVRIFGRDVRYQQFHGYVVPVVRRGGVTYAVTGDLDRATLLRLAATARIQY